MPLATDRNLSATLAAFSVSANLLQAGVLLAALGALIVAAGWPVIGAAGLPLAALAVAAVVVLALKMPPRVAMRFYGARRHEPESLRQVDELVAELARRARLMRVPDLYVVPSAMLSAFSVGTPERSAIAVTEGLLRRLAMREIAAVLAHEMGHIRRGDPFVLAVADLATRLTQALYYLGLGLAALNLFRLLTHEDPVSWWTVALLVLAPALMNLLQLGLPRAREFDADLEAALLTGDPLGLGSAISRLETSTGRPLDDLLPPVPARRVPLPSLLRCPPPADQRIRRLNALRMPPVTPLDVEEGPRISLVGVGPIEMRQRYRWSGVWF